MTDTIVIRGFTINGYHTVKIPEVAPQEEVLCQVANHQIVGLVAVVLKNGLCVGGDLLDYQQAKHCEFAVESAGKIYAFYQATTNKEDRVCYIGSGFKVSPTVIAAAAHVCPSIMTDEDTKVTYQLEAVYINLFDDQAGLSHTNVPLSRNCYKLKVLPPPQFQELSYAYTGPGGALCHWRTPNDFCFLMLDDPRVIPQRARFEDYSFIYPVLAPLTPKMECFVVGYPGFVNPKTWPAEGPDYDDVRTTFAGFDRKVISFGVATAHENEIFHRHNCPTLKGCSGGLFFAYGGTPLKGFSGIHIGGVSELNENFAIPTTNPNLALYYFKAISIDTKDFKSMDATRLKPYYDHFSAQLSNDIRANFAGFFK